MTNTPRVGLAGFSMAQQFHVGPIRDAGGLLAAVVTRDPERAATAERMGATVVATVEELVRVPDLDLVVIATPTGLHVEHALAVIAAGLPCVVDKPLGTDPENTAQVVLAAADAGVPLSVYQNRRWDLPHRQLQHLLAEGTLGELQALELSWGRWTPDRPQRWRELATAAEGGGVLHDLGSHVIDFALHLAGPAEVLYGDIRSRCTPADDDDRLALRHESGVVTTIHTSKSTTWKGRRVLAVGSRASYVFDMAGDDPAPGEQGWIVVGDDRTVAPAPPEVPSYYEQVFTALRSEDPQSLMPVQPGDAVATAAVVARARELTPA